MDVNGERFSGITDYPELVHGDIETQDLGKLGDYIQKMTGIGVLQPDTGLEAFVRQQAGLPERLEEYQAPRVNPTQDEDERAAEARKRLGRG